MARLPWYRGYADSGSAECPRAVVPRVTIGALCQGGQRTAMNVLGHAFLRAATKRRPSVPCIAGHLHVCNTTEAAIAPLPAQGIVPVGWSNPGSPKARKIQAVVARFATPTLPWESPRGCPLDTAVSDSYCDAHPTLSTRGSRASPTASSPARACAWRAAPRSAARACGTTDRPHRRERPARLLLHT